MICPSCGSKNTRVIDSRVSQDGSSIRRRRECEKCSFRFTTYEKIAFLSLVVIKKDGSREQFDREKLFEGIKKSFSKTKIEENAIESLVSKIESELSLSENQEVESSYIGEVVLKFIKDVDPVAYIRYASVFGGFDNISDFEEILTSAKKNLTEKNSVSDESKSSDSKDIKTPAFMRDHIEPPIEDFSNSKISEKSKKEMEKKKSSKKDSKFQNLSKNQSLF